jgi:hypothetical protein
MRENDFRRIALGMEGAVEGAHMGHPDFRVNNRIFATRQNTVNKGASTATRKRSTKPVRRSKKR